MAPLKSDIPFSIRRSARARRVRVTVDGAGEVIVTLPKKAAEKRAAEAVRELRPWIERRRQALLRAAEEVAREPGTLPYLGTDLRVVAEPGRERVHRRGDTLLVPARRRPRRDRALATGAAPGPRSRRGWTPPWPAPARATTASPSAASARAGRRARPRAAMSFNWRLLLAPEAVLDYVIEHEVCHLEVMDHSPRFWALLESRVPDWREHATWLRRYGSTLVL